jgi:hypothetical protein
MKKKILAALGMAAFCCMTATSTSFAGDNGNGTVTVNGLIWLKDAGCLPKGSYNAAKGAVAGLAGGQCRLTDGSTAGQWRLPSVAEMRALPANIGLFSNVPPRYFWTSDVKTSRYSGNPMVTLFDPHRVVTATSIEDPPKPISVWPVKK